MFLLSSSLLGCQRSPVATGFRHVEKGVGWQPAQQGGKVLGDSDELQLVWPGNGSSLCLLAMSAWMGPPRHFYLESNTHVPVSVDMAS